ncbi:lysozyme g-like [Colossoma macropomum]|uniref:lysozyme g-like n=1 Tax=Colossoma macropomum TaxID=42526 RepID=UPI001864B47E|nr:lysozyme g-like [Colossoma macropomum]
MGLQVIFSTALLACIFGDVTKIETTGASWMTASQDNLNVNGVEASYKLAETDLRRMDQYKSIITKVGNAKQMDPAVIAGIISRESRAGAVLVNGWGDNGNGFGLMQVDKRYHTPRGAWNSEEHITQGTEILIDSIKAIQRKFPNWPKEHQFKGGISAYNAGVGNVQTYEGMDIGTTGNDYSNDVVARAQWFKRHGY